MEFHITNKIVNTLCPNMVIPIGVIQDFYREKTVVKHYCEKITALLLQSFWHLSGHLLKKPSYALNLFWTCNFHGIFGCNLYLKCTLSNNIALLC